MGAAIPEYGSPDESVFVDNLERGERESLLYVWTRDADGKDSEFGYGLVDVAAALGLDSSENVGG